MAAGEGIHFSHQPITFRLENAQTPRKHAPETMAGGVAVFDYDGDSDLDVYFANGAETPGLEKTSPKYWNRLFENDGKANFTDVTGKAGLSGQGYATGVAVADYDNDGHKDIFVGGVHRYTLYRNLGDGTFRDVTADAGLTSEDGEFGPMWSVGAVWMDYDGDSNLDLFVVNYLRWDPSTEPSCGDYCHPKEYGGTPNRLYRNNGDGTFTDVSRQSRIREYVGKGMGAAFADYDQDGHPDVFVTNDKAFNFLLRNQGDGTYEEIAFEAGVALPEHAMLISGMGTDFRDLDNDGLADIVFVALEQETFPIFRNTGEGHFEEVTIKSGMLQLSKLISGYSPGIFDFDNDGWKDIFVSCGHVQSTKDVEGVMNVDLPNAVFRNLGDGTFDASASSAGFTERPPARHRGAAIGDFNGDGRLDAVVTALSAQAEIWMNETPGTNHWLEVHLEGTQSNRDGIGARLKVVTGTGTQFNHMTTSAGYASSSAGPVHFGLGQETSVDLLEIIWPSGVVQTITNVKTDRVLTIKEPR